MADDNSGTPKPAGTPIEASLAPMTKKSLASLILRLFGIYMLTGIAIWAPQVVGFFQRSSMSFGAVFALAGWLLLCLGLWLLPALVLLVGGKAIAAKLVGEDELVGDLRPWQSIDILRVVVMCLGISMVVSTIPQLAGLVANAVQMQDVMDPRWQESMRRGFISTGVRLGTALLLGMYLMLKPTVIVSLIGLLSGGGRQDTPGKDKYQDDPPVEEAR